MHTVGVAPGTITMQLGNGCPPDETWQYFTPPFKGYGMQRPGAAAGPSITVVEPVQTYEPYGTESKLEGRFGLLGAVDPNRTRWDIVAMVGGGALLVVVVLAAVASR